MTLSDRPTELVDTGHGVANELFVETRWWDVLRAAYGFDVRHLDAIDGSGTAAWVDIDDPVGARRISLPFCDLVDLDCDQRAWASLRTSFLDAPHAKLTTSGRHPIVQDPAFDSEIVAVHQVVPVDPTAEPGERYSTLSRRMVRKSDAAGITYRIAHDLDALATFHAMHVGVRKHRYGLLAQPFSFFEAIHEAYLAAGDGAVLLGEVDGEVVGGCVLLHTDDAVHYKFAATRPEYRSSGVSHGAVHAALQYSRDVGRPCFDFGRADLDQPGLVDFKRRFGALASPIAVSTRGELARSPFRDLLVTLTGSFTRPTTPDPLTALAGAHLYRYFA